MQILVSIPQYLLLMNMQREDGKVCNALRWYFTLATEFSNFCNP